MQNKIKRIAAAFLAMCLAGVFNAASLAPMTTAAGAELSLEGYSRNLSFEFYDNFDGYADESAVLENWTVAEDIQDAVSLVGIDGKNKALSVAESNISFNDAKNRYITKKFGTVLTEDKFVIEFTVKISAGMELSLINTENEEIPVFSGNKSGISCYTSDSDFETINEYTLSSSEYKRIKIIVDKTGKRFNIVTSRINKTYAYTQDIGSVAGIRFRAKKGSSFMFIDEVSAKISSDENSVYADFNGGKSFDGGLFYSSMGAGEDGLSLNCAEKVTNATDGSTEYKMNIADGTLQIDVDSDRLSEVLEFGNIGVEITYLDKGYGFIHAQYDTTAGKKELPAICMYNSGMKVSETVDANLEEKRQTYTLDDWVKNPDSGGYRLKIKTYEGEIEDGKQLRSGDRIYSKYPVTIKSIRLYDMRTAAPVKIELDTDKTGNIFYEGDTPKIKINLQNKSAENVKGSCRVICYKKNKNDSYRNPDETEVYNTYFGASVPAGEAYGAELVFPVTEFGLYRVTAEFTNDALGIAAAAETEFSRCVRVATQNYTVGVSSHLDQEGYADESLKLMKNAGLGLVREDFIWSDYEVKTGGDSTNGYTTEFRLNEKQEATLDAIDKYDMRLLMIVSGISWWHEGAHGNGSGFPSQQAIDLYFNDYVTHLLSEPKLIKVCDMVEVWNEPELTSQQDGVFLGDISLSGEAATAARFRKRGEAYGGLLDSVSQTIQYLNKSKGLDYRIGAFSLVTPWYPDTNYFMDNALNKLNDPKRSYYFDTISVHPYIWLSQDPEIGFGGSDNSNQMHYLGYKLDYVKALASGGSVYNNYTKEYEYPTGIDTGKSYSHTLREPLWITETGVSSADYDDDGVSAKSEYTQALNTIRIYNQIKLNDFENKVWFYGLSNSGNRTNEKEHGFGILNSSTDKVPLSAKATYLAIAAMNKLTEGAESAEEAVSDNFKFVTRYKGTNRDTYLLWTTKSDEQTLTYSELSTASNVKYYDLLGNEISKESVMSGGRYRLTREPFWAVKGEQIEYTASPDMSSAGLYPVKDGVGISCEGVNSAAKDTGVIADFGGNNDTTIMIAASYKENALVEVKIYNAEDGASYKVFGGVSFDEQDYDSAKIIMLNSENLIPLCQSLNMRDD